MGIGGVAVSSNCNQTIIWPSVKYIVAITCNHFLQLKVDWTGADPESDIYDCEVGLASEGSNVADVMPFTSTHGHQHILTYHPNMCDGQTVNLLVKAINKAGTETVEVQISLKCMMI